MKDKHEYEAVRKLGSTMKGETGIGTQETERSSGRIKIQGHVLVRHGESEGNIGLRSESPAAIGLTQRGFLQAEHLATQVLDEPGMIVISPFLRTRQTAGPTMERYPEAPFETWEVQEFTFLNPLKYAGTTQDERRVHARAYWARCDPQWNDGNGAESFVDFIGRVDRIMARLRQRRHQWVLVFTHGYFMVAAELCFEAQASVQGRDADDDVGIEENGFHGWGYW